MQLEPKRSFLTVFKRASAMYYLIVFYSKMDFIMFKYIKNISIIVIALFLFVFAFIRMISIGIDAGIENDFISNDEGIQRLQKKHIESTKQIIKEAQDMFVISVPKAKPVNNTSTFEYTKPRKSTISSKDKACNEAIFKVMSDKSEEAKTAKKKLCAHNLK